MELVYLKTFREVAKWGSYSRTAEVLGYSQPSITTQIQRLEESYGAVLFERYGRQMRLTMAGEALLHYANEILRLHAESKEVIAQQTAGTLSIGTIETLAAYYLPPLLQHYREHYPDMNMVLQPGNEPAIIQGVKEGQLDFGFILDTPYTDPEVYTISIRQEELVIVTPLEHRLTQQSQVVVRDLENESLVLTEEGCTYRALLLKSLKENNVSYRLMSEFGSLEAIKQCVMYGWGVALLPRFAVEDEVKSGKLSAVPFYQHDCHFYTQLIYLKRKWLPKAFEHFLRMLN